MAAVIFVFFLLSGWAVYNATETKSNFDLQLKIKDDQLENERDNNKKNIDLINKERSLEKREAALGEREREFYSGRAQSDLLISSMKKKYDALIVDNEKKTNELDALKEKYSDAALREKAESKLQKLMGDFTELGADVRNKNTCDKEGMKIYRQANSLLDQMLAIINSQKVGDGYEQFVKNKRNGIHFTTTDGC
jgi:hypothetical protein